MEQELHSIPCPRKFLPKQKKLLDLGSSGKHKYLLYSGAFAGGKTFLLCHFIIRECLKYPRSLWFFGSQTVPMLRDTILRTFMEEMDLYQRAFNDAGIEITLEKQFRSNTMSYKFYNDSEILFRSCDVPSKFKSLNLDGFALDEPVDISEEVFKMLQGRLRASHTPHHMGIMAGNPAGKTNWVYQRFFENATSDYYVVQTSTYDNVFLPTDYIPSLESSYDSEYKKRYLKGEWGSFEGLIFSDFSYGKHVGNYKDRDCKYHIAGYDDGYRNPACLLTLGIDNDNTVFVKDEVYLSGLTSTDLCEIIFEKNKEYNYQRIYSDPSAINIIELMRQKHLRVELADNDIDSGVAKMKSMFRNNLIYIDRSCVNLAKELESYRYCKDSDRRNKDEKPIKKDDHAVDSFRYGVSEFNPFRQASYCASGKFGGRR